MATCRIKRKVPKGDSVTKTINVGRVESVSVTMSKVMRERRRTYIEKEEVFELYRDGVPRVEIAKRVGISVNSVIGIISRGFQDGDLREYVISRDEQIVLDMYNAGASYKEISEATGMTGGTISAALTRLRREGMAGYRK